MQVKSKFAAFDPAKFGKTKDILAGLGGLAAAKKAGLITTDDKK